MNKDPKILTYLDDIIDSYNEPAKIVDGLYRNPKEIIRTIEFYSNDKYLSGNTDELGREKAFYQIGNFRVTVAKTATDIDVKDIKYNADSLDDSVAAMLINHELYKYLKESNFSETLNDMGKARPKYGHLIVKKSYYDGKLCIDVCDLTNMDFDPKNVNKGTKIETHYLYPSEFAEKEEAGWENIDEVMKAHAKANKNRPAQIEIKEISGDFDYTFDPDMPDDPKNTVKFKPMCFYIAVVGKKKFLVYKEDLKKGEDKYKGLAWEKVKLSLGRGVVEDGFEAQWATNDTMLDIKNAMKLAGKVVLSTDSNKVSGNAITGVDNGHIFQLEQGRSLTSVNLSASNMPEFHNIIELWKEQYNNSVSVHDANTGEAPTANTPYSQTALLNQVANTPFEYQREVWGIFLNEILNDWIFPYLVKKITKKHYLVSEFSDEELAIIDEAIHIKAHNSMVKDMLLVGQVPTEEDVTGLKKTVDSALNKFGKKREVEVPEKFLDIKGKLTANITGELQNKAAVLASLAQIGSDIAATYNPNTGQYAAMQDPFLRKLYGTIINLAGTPLSSHDLKPSAGTGAPMAQPDQSAIAPMSPNAPVSPLPANPAMA